MDIAIYEKVIGTLAITHAHEYHDARFFTWLDDEDLRGGKLAASLEFFDLLATHCSAKGCYTVAAEALEYLRDLSVDECLELKAYHSWKLSGKPYPNSDPEKSMYYYTALETLVNWCQKPCQGNARAALTYVKESVAHQRENLLAKKGYWSYLKDNRRSWEYNSAAATEYLDTLQLKLGSTISPSDLVQTMKKFKEVMAVNELVALKCITQNI